MIGVSCTDFSSRDFEEVWDEVSRGFSHWEIFSEADHSVGKVAERFLEREGSYSMTYSIHAPICDTNLASLNERMREASVFEMMSVMEYAGAMGIKTITVHPGVHSLAVHGVEDRSVACSKNSMRILDRASREYGVDIAIENMPSVSVMLGRTADELEEILEGTDLKVCLDLGHANTTGQTDELLGRFAGRIINVHVHDNNGDRDAHLTVGEGNMDFSSLLPKLKRYKGNLIIESKSMESAIESKAVLEKILSE